MQVHAAEQYIKLSIGSCVTEDVLYWSRCQIGTATSCCRTHSQGHTLYSCELDNTLSMETMAQTLAVQCMVFVVALCLVSTTTQGRPAFASNHNEDTQLVMSP